MYVFVRIYHFTSSSQFSDYTSTPVPIKIFNPLDNNQIIIYYAKLLINKVGIYCFVNTVNKGI